MACCGPDAKKKDFTKEKYEDVILNINQHILSFHTDVNDGTFTLENNNNNIETENMKNLKIEIQNLENHINENNNKKIELQKKINEIDEKINAMNTILKTDVSEREYLNHLAEKINPQDMIDF